MAAVVGIDNFIETWRILDRENIGSPKGGREKARLYVPLFSSYLRFLRNRFIRALFEQGRSVASIQRAIREQLDVFEGLPLNDQVALLKDAVEQFTDIDALHAELLAAYLSRDLATLEALNEVSMQTGDQRLARDFQQRLILDRNRRMAERMQEHLEAGGAFIAVGALHLPGEQGLLELLEQQGYSVRVVY